MPQGVEHDNTGLYSSVVNSEQQLKQAVREVLAEMLGVGIEQAAAANRQWYDTGSAYSLLGFDDAEQLREAVRSGLFRVGHPV